MKLVLARSALAGRANSRGGASPATEIGLACHLAVSRWGVCRAAPAAVTC
jgi:hypothetical protein